MEFVRQSFNYSTGWVTLNSAAIGNTTTTTVAIRADADFESTYIVGSVRQGGLLVTNWSGLIQVNDPGAGRDLFNVAIPFDNIMGNGRDPFTFLPARVWRAASSIVITWTQSTVTATDACITFAGNKLFPTGTLADPTRV